MRYFSWMLGIGVALGFGIINTMWLDSDRAFALDAKRTGASRSESGSMNS